MRLLRGLSASSSRHAWNCDCPGRRFQLPRILARSSAAHRSATSVLWGINDLQPPSFRARHAAASAPRRSQPVCSISTRVVPSAWSAKVIPWRRRGRDAGARDSRAARRVPGGDLAPGDLSPVGRAFEDPPTDAGLEQDRGRLARNGVVVRPPAAEGSGSRGERMRGRTPNGERQSERPDQRSSPVFSA
jgi:hypothetical protein